MQRLIDPKLLQRLQVGPLAQYFDAYLARIEHDGFLASSVPCQAYAITRFSRWLKQKGLRPDDLDESTVRKFLGRDPGVAHYPERATIRRLVLILRELGVVKADAPLPLTPPQVCIEEYRRYLVRDRGLSQASLPNYLSFVHQFLHERFPQGELCLAELRAVDVITFVKAHAVKLSPGRKKLLVTALRAFLRYLQHQGKIEVGLAACVPPVASWSFSAIPKSLPHGTVQRVLAGHDRSTPVGQRNYAILLLLARLGLRAGEVGGLNLEDLDWDKGLVQIRRKGSRWTQLPLPVDVGAAIAVYLQSGRPPCSSRRVFLRHRAPIRGFARNGCVSSIVHRTLIAAGVDSERKGAHLFRHTLAVDLLRNGASLDEIGNVLGHRSPNTTALYAKVDVAALRSLALPWPGGAR
ncbi:MAG TPA: site-specific integrase [Candidatus Acidoferrales bacterium]|nr:site-specific integrase [Candidatus Acidoferrales bacterium]